jgi:hypothetical protein
MTNPKPLSHVSTEYRGFSICEKCDIILCPINSLDECKGKPVAGAREYIDRLKSHGMPVAPLQAELERLQAELEREKNTCGGCGQVADGWGICDCAHEVQKEKRVSFRAELAAAKADNETLRARVAGLEASKGRLITIHTQKERELAEMVVHLREALERIAKPVVARSITGKKWEIWRGPARIARAALEQK